MILNAECIPLIFRIKCDGMLINVYAQGPARLITILISGMRCHTKFLLSSQQHGQVSNIEYGHNSKPFARRLIQTLT